MRNACRVWVGKPEGRRTRGRHTCRWENIIEGNLTELRCVGVYWIEGCCEVGSEHSGSINGGESALKEFHI